MIARVLAIFMSLLLGVLLMSAGIIAGIKMQSEFENKAYATYMEQTLRIAVVNQDMGVSYNGEEINFSAEIIDTFGDEYVLTSKTVAESGVKNGNYAAAISFPSDFSTKLLEINVIRPETATFNYQLSSSLSQKDCIEILLKILELEKNVNETITYMYTTSAFGELHDAQATVENLMKNEEISIESVHNFIAAEMVPTLEISNMERNIPEIDYPDLSEYMNENDSVLNDLLEKYSEYMELSYSDYTQIVSNADSVISDTQSVSDAIDAIEMLPGSDSSGKGDHFNDVLMKEESDIRDRFSKYKDMLESGGNNLSSYNDASSILKTLEIPEFPKSDMDEPYLEKICDILVLLLETDASEKIEGTGSGGEEEEFPATQGITIDPRVEDETNELLTIIDEILKLQGNHIENYFNEFIEDLTDEFGEEISAEFEELLLETDSCAEAEVTALTDAIDSLRGYIKSAQDTEKANLTEAYAARNQALSEINTQIAGYDPTKYISDHADEISSFNTRFRENNRVFDEQVNEVINDRSELIFEVYDNYEKYVEQLGEDMQSTTEQSKDLLDVALEELLSSQMNKKDNNIELIGTFSEKLPNTRIGSQDNSDFYSFFVAPVKISEIGYGAQGAFSPPVQKGIVSVMDWIQIVVRLAALFFVIVSITFLLIKSVIRRSRTRFRHMEEVDNYV